MSVTASTSTFLISPDGKYVSFSMAVQANSLSLFVLTLDYASGVSVVNRQILD